MLNTRNLCLLLLLLSLVGLDFLQRAGFTQDGRTEPLFPGFDPQQVAHIEIECADEGVHLDLEAGRWVVRERQGFPAEPFLVESLIKRLPDLVSADQVAREENSRGLYGLDEGHTAVRLSSNSGELLAAFRAGLPANEAQGCYLQPEGENGIYRAASMGVPQLDPALWLNLHLVAGFDMTRVTGLDLDLGGDRRLRLQALEHGRWNAVGLDKSIAPAKLQHLMSFALNVVLKDVAVVTRAEAGLEPPRLGLTLILDDGIRRLQVGGPLGSGRAMASPDWGSDWVAEVPNSSAQSLETTAEQIYTILTRE